MTLKLFFCNTVSQTTLAASEEARGTRGAVRSTDFSSFSTTGAGKCQIDISA